MMIRRKFIIHAPRFDHRSAGNVVLHHLNNSLNDVGETSKLIFFGDCLDPADQDAIVIYPEIIHNNPLKAKHICRYILNKDGLLTGKKIEKSDNQISITYSRIFDQELDVLFFPILDLNELNFQDNIEERELNLVYFGKGPALNFNLDGTEPHLLITRKWPKERELLISFLKTSRFLHISDSICSMIVEALLCGCIPIIHHWNPAFTQAELQCGELPEILLINQEKDFSTGNALAKAASLANRVMFYQKNWLPNVQTFAQKAQSFFG